MMNRKKLTVLAFTLVLVLCLSACQAGNPAPGTTAAPETTVPPMTVSEPAESTEQPTETVQENIATEPAVEINETLKELQVLRLQDVSQSHMERIIAKYMPQDGNLAFIHITSPEAMEAMAEEMGSEIFLDISGLYDAAFFESYELLLVPRVTNTGSVTHTYQWVPEGEDTLVAQITAVTPEIVTMDMAHWMLLIPIQKDVAQGRTLTAALAAPEGLLVPGTDGTQPTIGFARG